MFADMKKLLFVLLILSVNISNLKAQKMSCEELKLYRDVTLLSILDAETAKAKQQINTLKNCKTILENELAKLNKAKSDSEVKMAMTALKGAYDQATSILAGIKAAKGAIKVVVTVATVADNINKGKGRLDVLLAENERKAFVTAVENEVIGAIPVVSNIYSMYQTIKDLKSLNKERNQLTSSITKANNSLETVTNKMSTAMNGVKRINDYQYYISDYMNKYCPTTKMK